MDKEVNFIDKKSFINHFQSLDRKLFIDDDLKDKAHFDRPLPIGHDQTISQPSLVAQMTIELDSEQESRVLEIGTGSGYQTAL